MNNFLSLVLKIQSIVIKQTINLTSHLYTGMTKVVTSKKTHQLLKGTVNYTRFTTRKTKQFFSKCGNTFNRYISTVKNEKKN